MAQYSTALLYTTSNRALGGVPFHCVVPCRGRCHPVSFRFLCRASCRRFVERPGQYKSRGLARYVTWAVRAFVCRIVSVHTARIVLGLSHCGCAGIVSSHRHSMLQIGP